MKTIGMIPALSGGQRLPDKNLLLVNGEPMISYVIRAAKESKVFDEIYINTDILEFKNIAKQYGVKYFFRDPKKGGSACEMFNHSMSCNGERCQVHDHFIYDFLQNVDCEYLVQIHTTSPLIQPDTIVNFVNLLKGNDSAFTVVENHKESFYKNSPLNFSFEKKTMTQQLEKVEEISWALSGWRTVSFVEAYEEKETSPTWVGRRAFLPISKIEAIDVDTIDDLFIAEACLSHLKKKESLAKFKLNDEVKSIERNLEKLIAEDGSPLPKKGKTHNLDLNNIDKAIELMGNGSWCYPVVLSDTDQACFIQQNPGEGCRKHYHATKDEWWIVFKGEFSWETPNKTIHAKEGDIVFLPKGTVHIITCTSDSPGIRLAMGAREMEHVYV